MLIIASYIRERAKTHPDDEDSTHYPGMDDSVNGINGLQVGQNFTNYANLKEGTVCLFHPSIITLGRKFEIKYEHFNDNFFIQLNIVFPSMISLEKIFV